jgi:hypothetical protein
MFLLTKWYCDCVSPEGDAFLGYWAKLRWGPITVPYAATLVRAAGGPTRERGGLRACPPPETRDGTLAWDCRTLGIRGRWRGSQPPFHQTLLDDGDGGIAWRCHVPAAAVQVQLADGRSLAGLGYAEELTLSVAPSRLPFNVLRWGRFVSDRDSLTWIQWQGRTPRQWVIQNGAAVSGAAIDENEVRLAGDHGVLQIHDSVTLRDGPLASTALRAIPGARYWLLKGVEHAHETKWLSAGTLTTATHASSGWVIHEVVHVRPE